MSSSNDEQILGDLNAELQQSLILLQSPETYKRIGRAYALSTELPHQRQRFAARGDAEKSTGMFATPRMEEYEKQSESFEQGKPVLTAAEDVKEEALADPISPISGGRAFALSTELPYERQRFAARGDAEISTGMFATPRMEAYKKLSESFEKGEQVPTVLTEDVKEEALADPIGPISAALSLQIQFVIQALMSIQNILDSAAQR